MDNSRFCICARNSVSDQGRNYCYWARVVDKIRKMKRILILGGGFAGVECCLDLESYFKNNKDIEITLVSDCLLYTSDAADE